jgi:basic membrane lipoprotein Med (substrate-binding protein (PBP1-ABC) superfamily)
MMAALTAVVLIAAACGTAATPTPVPTVGPTATVAPTETPVRLVVGAIHVGSIKDAGYNEAEHDGLIYMTENVPGIKLIEAENVPESPDVERVMENMVAQGAKLIFPQSFGYQDFALEVAAKHSDVYFAHPSGYKLADNFGTYWGESYQLQYVLGIAAGLTTKTNKIGFIGGYPIPQIIFSINAFHLGARSVNPAIQTVAVFNSTWVDPAKEAQATNALADQGVDVVSSIVDSPITVVQTAEKRGIYSIGYHSAAVAQFAPKGWISGIDFQFGTRFVKYANDVINGTWKSENYYGPELSVLAPWGSAVSDGARAQVQAKLTAIQGGAPFFVGPIYDQAGTLRLKEGETADYNLANTIDWFAEGIVGQTK